MQLQALRKSEVFPDGGLVLRQLSWDTTRLLDGLEPKPDLAHGGGELADGMCWAGRVGKTSHIKLL